MSRILAVAFFLFAVNKVTLVADYLPPNEGDYTIRDFKFVSGQTLPEFKIHYRTLGKVEKDASGKVTNAVLIMQINHSTPQNSSSFSLTESVTANRASRATHCTRNFRATVTSTWSRHNIAC